MDVLGTRSLGSIHIWLPGPEDLRDFSVEEELGGLTYLGRQRGTVDPPVPSQFTVCADSWGWLRKREALCSVTGIATFGEGSR